MEEKRNLIDINCSFIKPDMEVTDENLRDIYVKLNSYLAETCCTTGIYYDLEISNQSKKTIHRIIDKFKTDHIYRFTIRIFADMISCEEELDAVKYILSKICVICDIKDITTSIPKKKLKFVVTHPNILGIPFVREVHTEVSLINISNDPLEVIYTGARTCYSNEHPVDIIHKVKENGIPGISDIKSDSMGKSKNVIQHCLDSGHLSVMEHASFTFAIQCSRATSHQLVRTRMASYSQKSQRYCGVECMEVIIPNRIRYSDWAKMIFLGSIYKTMKAAIYLKDMLSLKNEDVRALYHNAAATTVVMTLNLRSLFTFTDERSCACAQDEIRYISKNMADRVRGHIPFLKDEHRLDAKCHHLGYCPESKERTCGRFPLKADVLEGYAAYKKLSK